jgi:hypothetical protein
MGPTGVIYQPGEEHRPSRLIVEIHQLKAAITAFPKASCKLIGEFPSITRLDDTHAEPFEPSLDSEAVMRVNRSVKRWINTAYQLTRKEATEILVFMVNDLDSHFHAELNNSYPVAYAMKGPSMSTAVVC